LIARRATLSETSSRSSVHMSRATRHRKKFNIDLETPKTAKNRKQQLTKFVVADTFADLSTPLDEKVARLTIDD